MDINIREWPIKEFQFGRWLRGRPPVVRSRIFRCDYAGFRVFIRVPDGDEYRLDQIRQGFLDLAQAYTLTAVDEARIEIFREDSRVKPDDSGDC